MLHHDFPVFNPILLMTLWIHNKIPWPNPRIEGSQRYVTSGLHSFKADFRTRNSLLPLIKHQMPSSKEGNQQLLDPDSSGFIYRPIRKDHYVSKITAIPLITRQAI
ncbi:hypothetical protein ACOME3_003512 [Neoechinorhynchus agilis]